MSSEFPLLSRFNSRDDGFGSLLILRELGKGSSQKMGERTMDLTSSFHSMTTHRSRCRGVSRGKVLAIRLSSVGLCS